MSLPTHIQKFFQWTSIPSIALAVVAFAFYAYDFIDSKGKEHKDALIRRNPGVVTVVDVYGRSVPAKEFCVNGVIYFGSPMVALIDREGKVVPCSWEVTMTEKDKK